MFIASWPRIFSSANKFFTILVKFSGEAFGSKGGKINPKLVQLIVEEIKALSRLKVKVAIICGGGNILRGREIKNGDRVLADSRGMRATLKNVDFLYKALVKNQVPSKVYTSFSLISKYPKFTKAIMENILSKTLSSLKRDTFKNSQSADFILIFLRILLEFYGLWNWVWKFLSKRPRLMAFTQLIP